MSRQTQTDQHALMKRVMKQRARTNDWELPTIDETRSVESDTEYASSDEGEQKGQQGVAGPRLEGKSAKGGTPEGHRERSSATKKVNTCSRNRAHQRQVEANTKYLQKIGRAPEPSVDQPSARKARMVASRQRPSYQLSGSLEEISPGPLRKSFALEAHLYQCSLEEERLYGFEEPSAANSPEFYGWLLVAFMCLVVMAHITYMVATAGPAQEAAVAVATNLSAVSSTGVDAASLLRVNRIVGAVGH